MLKPMMIMVAALAVVLGGIFGWKAFVGAQMAAHMAAAKPPPAVVSSAPVKRETWRSQLTAVGTLRAVQSIDLTAEVDGIVREIRFESGTEAHRGEPLVRLDTETEQAQLKSLEAQADLARTTFERDRKLNAQGHVSEARLDASKSSLDSLLAQVDEQRAMIAKKTITAPFNGRLGIRRVNLGQYVKAGAPMVGLQQLDPIYVDFTVPERYLERMGDGQTVRFTVAAFPGRGFDAKVTAVSPEVDPQTRNVALQATADNADRALRPGMSAQVTLNLRQERQVLTLPLSAVTYNPYGSTVYMIVEDGGQKAVRIQPVGTGEVRGGTIEVTRGLKPGQEVVSAGQNKLRNGMAVAVNNSVSPPQAVNLP
ncbi:MAG: efflux RND transporter periplasmic adaptor subunit [Alphaproteobacteria bacterium]|nr:efflux RND transporter periplasmic adaptor subunit [Alphaproteobacteria bacterium]